jgi:outer membrane protein TolC
MHVFRLQCVLAALALLPAVAGAQPAATATNTTSTTAEVRQPALRALVEGAVRRSPQARTLDARLDENQAARDLAASWLADAPSVGLAQRGDRWTDQRGRREAELSVSAPVWLPRQKSARTALAQAGADELAAHIALVRLDLAGQVRRLLWDVAAARAAQAEQEEHLRHLEALAADVQRRVAAGDLARSDGLLAQQEVLAARQLAATARLRATEVQGRFRLLTGLAAPADPEPEPLMDDAAPAPLRLQAAQATEQRARAAVAAAGGQAGAAPTVALSIRQERDGNLAPRDRGIGVALTIPLNIPLISPLRNRPAETAAATQLAGASAERAQAELEAAAALSLAREQLAQARESLRDAEQRAAVMQEHLRLMHTAFQVGERGLADVLRSRALAHEAQVALRQQRIALGQAHAGLNQALGIVP